jgi:glycosyltransferase involved in cell wall biosynthesis
MDTNKTNRPLLTIAIPTYNREKSLKDIVLCYLKQDFQDFEIIIANDYIDKKLSHEELGIGLDARVSIINNKKNLGELENMNFLLTLAKGQYFTWQFDDDPCSDLFLSKMANAIIKFGNPDSIFSSFETIYGNGSKRLNCSGSNQVDAYSGHKFVERYLNKELKSLGCCGFYKLDFLKNLGGVTRLSSGPMALYSEFLLLINQVAAKKVVHINIPLVSTRHHPGSWTYRNSDILLFEEAGLNYIKKSYIALDNAAILLKHELLLSVIKFVLASVSVKRWQTKMSNAGREIDRYTHEIKLECSVVLDIDANLKLEGELDFFAKHSWLYFTKSMFKRFMPLSIFNVLKNFWH